MKIKVYIDGQEGTTGLKINERIANHPDVELLKIEEEKRKDLDERGRLLNQADVAFLCLPDIASRQAVELVTNPDTRVIDASTAFRTDDSWVYGFPELSPAQREKIRRAKRVAVPGCHATGFTAAVYPLRSAGIIGADYPIACQSISGYSGGGKKLIRKYEQDRADGISMKSPRFYALGLKHKHLPEMVKVNGLSHPPVFTPVVGDYDRGMLVSVPLSRRLMNKKMDAESVWKLYSEYYQGEKFIQVMPFNAESNLEDGFLSATGCNGTNRLQLFVYGHDDQVVVISRLDNLGKGASGAAVQCMNIMLGRDESAGLSE